MNNSVYRIGFFIMLLVNIALLVFILSKPKAPRHSQRRIALRDQIPKKLDFDESQKAEFEKLAQNHRGFMLEIKSEEKPHNIKNNKR